MMFVIAATTPIIDTAHLCGTLCNAINSKSVLQWVTTKKTVVQTRHFWSIPSCRMSSKVDVPALSFQSAGASANKSAENSTLPGSSAPSDIAAALPGFLPAILAAVRSRSVNTAALVRDKVKRSRSPR
jgi:hypothetical protein